MLFKFITDGKWVRVTITNKIQKKSKCKDWTTP